jgi:lipoprotein signal peptidase
MNASVPIIAGGGWKKTRKEKIKVKAWGFFLTFVLFLGIGFSCFDQLGVFVFLPAAIMLLIYTILFFLEKPSTVEMPSEKGGHDLRKLYGLIW